MNEGETRGKFVRVLEAIIASKSEIMSRLEDSEYTLFCNTLSDYLHQFADTNDFSRQNQIVAELISLDKKFRKLGNIFKDIRKASGLSGGQVYVSAKDLQSPTVSSSEVQSTAKRVLSLYNKEAGTPENAEIDLTDGLSNNPISNQPNSEIVTWPHLDSEDYAIVDSVFLVHIGLKPERQLFANNIGESKPIQVEREPNSHYRELLVDIVSNDFETINSDTQKITFVYQSAYSNEAIFLLKAKPLSQESDQSPQRIFSRITALIRDLKGRIIGQVHRTVEILESSKTLATLPANFPPPFGKLHLDEEKSGKHLLNTIHSQPIRSSEKGERPIGLIVDIVESPFHPDILDWLLIPFTGHPVSFQTKSTQKEGFIKNTLIGGLGGKLNKVIGADDEKQGEIDKQILDGILQSLRETVSNPISGGSNFFTVYTQALQEWNAASTSNNDDNFSILIRTTDTHIPWELMPLDNDSFEPAPFRELLGTKHRVTRWIDKLGNTILPPLRLNLKGMTVVAPIYEENQLEHAQKEKLRYGNWFNAHMIDANDKIRDFLKNIDSGIFHFSGHGESGGFAGKVAWLKLAKGQEFSIFMANSPSGHNIAPDVTTFAFFNACKASMGDQIPLGSIGGWASVLLNRGYAGYMGPLWNVSDFYARKAGETFYSLVLTGKNSELGTDNPKEEQEFKSDVPLGEAIRQIRRKFISEELSISYLAYTLYGHPDGVIQYQPEILGDL